MPMLQLPLSEQDQLLFAFARGYGTLWVAKVKDKRVKFYKEPKEKRIIPNNQTDNIKRAAKRVQKKDDILAYLSTPHILEDVVDFAGTAESTTKTYLQELMDEGKAARILRRHDGKGKRRAFYYQIGTELPWTNAGA